MSNLSRQVWNFRLARDHRRRFYFRERSPGGHRHRGARESQGKKPTMLVGYDTRFFSEEFTRSPRTSCEHGIHTLLCEGLTPTPAVACEILRRKVDGAINFTASHNPAEYQGLKFSSADAGPALPEVTKDIEARAAKLTEKAAFRLYRTVRRTPSAVKKSIRANYLSVWQSSCISTPSAANSGRRRRAARLRRRLSGSRAHRSWRQCAGAAHRPRLALRRLRPGRLRENLRAAARSRGHGSERRGRTCHRRRRRPLRHRRFRRARGCSRITSSACYTITSSRRAAGKCPRRAAWPLRT